MPPLLFSYAAAAATAASTTTTARPAAMCSSSSSTRTATSSSSTASSSSTSSSSTAAAFASSSFPSDVLARHGEDCSLYQQLLLEDNSLSSSSSSADNYRNENNNGAAASVGPSDRECCDQFASTMRKISSRVENLLERLRDEEEGGGGEGAESSESPVREACRRSLTVLVPFLLGKVSLLIDGVDDVSEDGGSKRMIGKLRATFALVNCVQYLDTIDAAASSESRAALDERLGSVLRSISRASSSSSDDFTAGATTAFRISHWVAPALAFDVPAGRPAFASLDCHREDDGDSDALPLKLRVEPVVSYRAEDLTSGKSSGESAPPFRRCAVEIEKCAHRSKEFAEGAGTIGVAQVRIKVTPLDERSSRNRHPRIWGEEEADRLCVTDARV